MSDPPKIKAQGRKLLELCAYIRREIISIYTAYTNKKNGYLATVTNPKIDNTGSFVFMYLSIRTENGR